MEKLRHKARAAQHPPTRIVVEHVYLGGQSMEEAFQTINEQTVKKNIEEMVKKAI